MLKGNVKFHSENGKRLILIAEDEWINREILAQMLAEDYELIFAEDGAETMAQMREHAATLSLVLLDILMPVMSGLEVLKAAREEEALSRIPIIVMTAEREAEIESLKLGAIDFIPKPYPATGVIQARVLRTIELSEDRDIIQSTERDELTGLYNKEFFFKYAEQFDQYHKDLEMDAVVVDVSHFHMLNERYGRTYGDEILKRIGEEVRGVVADSGGIVCRREADTFLVYCPHRDDWRDIMDRISAHMADDDANENRVRLRMGVYERVDKSIDIERRFDRAKVAADTVKGSVTNTIGMYDDSLHERQLFAEQLIEDFPAAIAEKQFRVFYQPKFDIRADVPLLTSAEALVRWVHPTLGMVSPGVFIPLFEENGLIQRLDTYVWEETAAQIADWKERLGYAVPISVNVSRIDMYNPDIAENLTSLLAEQGLSGEDMYLEVTESAYTQDSKQIIDTAQQLRDLGFQIEMDDFGTGYSSLNLLSTLPIDALKLDMNFVQGAFAEGGSTHMLEVIIGISDYLGVPVIAEGVETEEQLHVLKALGCDIVQGYFFSRPVPAADFEAFILQKKEADLALAGKPAPILSVKPEDDPVRQAKLSALMEQIEPTATEAPEAVAEEPESRRATIHLKTISVIIVILSFISALALFVTDVSVTNGHNRMLQASERYTAAQLDASELEAASDYLTGCVRAFVMTGDITYLKAFYEEVNVTQRRDKAVESLAELLGNDDAAALENLNMALALSNDLVNVENLAMRLTVEAGEYNAADIPKEIHALSVPAEYRGMSAEELRAAAISLVFDENYLTHKDSIREHVGLCTQELIASSEQELNDASSRLSRLVSLQTVLTVVFLLMVLAVVAIITIMVRKPLTTMVEKMRTQESIRPKGVEELRFVTRTYNEILQENRDAQEKLSHEASRDPLTGLFNRGAYDLLMESVDVEHMALLLVDVDYFKTVNDTYGHAVGDRILKKVADTLRQSFRSVDILCRVGGDEFAVVMTRVNSSMGQLVIDKIARANDLLQHPKDGLPPVSLSVGAAFADRENPAGDIYQDADAALYRVKEAGRNGCAIY